VLGGSFRCTQTLAAVSSFERRKGSSMQSAVLRDISGWRLRRSRLSIIRWTTLTSHISRTSLTRPARQSVSSQTWTSSSSNLKRRHIHGYFPEACCDGGCANHLPDLRG